MTGKHIFATVKARLVTRMVRIKTQGEIYEGNLFLISLDLIYHSFDIDVIQLLSCFLYLKIITLRIVSSYCLEWRIASSASFRRHTSWERSCTGINSLDIFKGHIVIRFRSLFYFNALLLGNVVPKLRGVNFLIINFRWLIMYCVWCGGKVLNSRSRISVCSHNPRIVRPTLHTLIL